MPHYADDHLTIYQGHALDVLRELPDESVHCVVTSPPYWGLRDYGLPPLVWGGDAEHKHEWITRERPGMSGGTASEKVRTKGTDNFQAFGPTTHASCPCGAWRGSLGLEPTPEMWVEHLVVIFREVRRVLRRDGTVWLNVGDAYAHASSGGGSAVDLRTDGRRTTAGDRVRGRMAGSDTVGNLRPKDLLGLPWRLAFALQADGWYLRSDIVWSKVNPMPESVTDRPTRSHEYVFLLARSARYFYDAEAVREGRTGNTHSRGTKWQTEDGMVKVAEAGSRTKNNKSFQAAMLDQPDSMGRNLRSVWTIATEPYPEAHFATFPRKLVEPCVKAGTSERGVCPECGAPWMRVVSVTRGERDDSTRNGARAAARLGMAAVPEKGWESQRATIGWRPTCAHHNDNCDDDPTGVDQSAVPAVVLDPFAGSGTVAVVAEALGRRSVLIELSEPYVAQIMERVAQGRRVGTGAPLDMPLEAPEDSLWSER